MTRSARANLLLLLAAAIWGSAFVAQSVGADSMPPAAFTAVRHAISVAVLLPVVFWYDRSQGISRAQARVYWAKVLVPGSLIGVALFAGSYLQQFGIEFTTAGNAGFITSLYMVLVPLAGRIFGQRISGLAWVGVALATVGLYLLSIRGGFTMSFGDTLVLGGAVAWTIQILLVDRFAPNVDALRLAITEFAACAVVAGGVSLVAEQPNAFAGISDAMIPLLYTAVLSTGVGFTVQILAQRDAKPSTAALIMSLEAVFAVVAGAIVLHERMDVRSMVGCALMLAGIVLAQLNPPKPPAEVHP